MVSGFLQSSVPSEGEVPGSRELRFGERLALLHRLLHPEETVGNKQASRRHACKDLDETRGKADTDCWKSK